MTPRIWVLLGEKTGDNNQVLALAEELGLPFETRSLRYTLLRAVPPRYLGATFASLTSESRAFLEPPWPELIIAIGRRSVPVAREIRRRAGGGTAIVLVGHPRVHPSRFDLIITTRQYPVPTHDNVVMLPMAMSRLLAAEGPRDDERAWLDAHQRPHLLLAIGGPPKYWRLSPARLEDAARMLKERAEAAGGTLIAVGSRRTPLRLMDVLRRQLDGTSHVLVEAGSPRFAVLMRDADQIFVTGDSISMLSEAIQTGKPVGMIPLDLTIRGERLLERGRKRDIRRIWAYLLDQGFVGTVEKPSCGDRVELPVKTAAAAVRRLLDLRAAAAGTT